MAHLEIPPSKKSLQEKKKRIETAFEGGPNWFGKQVAGIAAQLHKLDIPDLVADREGTIQELDKKNKRIAEKQIQHKQYENQIQELEQQIQELSREKDREADGKDKKKKEKEIKALQKERDTIEKARQKAGEDLKKFAVERAKTQIAFNKAEQGIQAVSDRLKKAERYLTDALDASLAKAKQGREQLTNQQKTALENKEKVETTLASIEAQIQTLSHTVPLDIGQQQNLDALIAQRQDLRAWQKEWDRIEYEFERTLRDIDETIAEYEEESRQAHDLCSPELSAAKTAQPPEGFSASDAKKFFGKNLGSVIWMQVSDKLEGLAKEEKYQSSVAHILRLMKQKSVVGIASTMSGGLLDEFLEKLTPQDAYVLSLAFSRIDTTQFNVRGKNPLFAKPSGPVALARNFSAEREKHLEEFRGEMQKLIDASSLSDRELERLKQVLDANRSNEKFWQKLVHFLKLDLARVTSITIPLSDADQWSLYDAVIVLQALGYLHKEYAFLNPEEISSSQDPDIVRFSLPKEIAKAISEPDVQKLLKSMDTDYIQYGEMDAYKILHTLMHQHKNEVEIAESLNPPQEELMMGSEHQALFEKQSEWLTREELSDFIAILSENSKTKDAEKFPTLLSSLEEFWQNLALKATEDDRKIANENEKSVVVNGRAIATSPGYPGSISAQGFVRALEALGMIERIGDTDLRITASVPSPQDIERLRKRPDGEALLKSLHWLIHATGMYNELPVSEESVHEKQQAQPVNLKEVLVAGGVIGAAYGVAVGIAALKEKFHSARLRLVERQFDKLQMQFKGVNDLVSAEDLRNPNRIKDLWKKLEKVDAMMPVVEKLIQMVPRDMRSDIQSGFEELQGKIKSLKASLDASYEQTKKWDIDDQCITLSSELSVMKRRIEAKDFSSWIEAVKTDVRVRWMRDQLLPDLQADAEKIMHDDIRAELEDELEQLTVLLADVEEKIPAVYEAVNEKKVSSREQLVKQRFDQLSRTFEDLMEDLDSLPGVDNQDIRKQVSGIELQFQALKSFIPQLEEILNTLPEDKRAHTKDEIESLEQGLDQKIKEAYRILDLEEQRGPDIERQVDAETQEAILADLERLHEDLLNEGKGGISWEALEAEMYSMPSFGSTPFRIAETLRGRTITERDISSAMKLIPEFPYHSPLLNRIVEIIDPRALRNKVLFMQATTIVFDEFPKWKQEIERRTSPEVKNARVLRELQEINTNPAITQNNQPGGPFRDGLPEPAFWGIPEGYGAFLHGLQVEEVREIIYNHKLEKLVPALFGAATEEAEAVQKGNQCGFSIGVARIQLPGIPLPVSCTVRGDLAIAAGALGYRIASVEGVRPPMPERAVRQRLATLIQENKDQIIRALRGNS